MLFICSGIWQQVASKMHLSPLNAGQLGLCDVLCNTEIPLLHSSWMLFSRAMVTEYSDDFCALPDPSILPRARSSFESVIDT